MAKQRGSKTAQAIVQIMKSAKMMFVPSTDSSKDTLLVALGKIAHTLFSIDLNDPKNMLYLPGIHQATKRQIAAHYNVALAAATQAGWEMIVENASIFDDISI